MHIVWKSLQKCHFTKLRAKRAKSLKNVSNCGHSDHFSTFSDQFKFTLHFGTTLARIICRTDFWVVCKAFFRHLSVLQKLQKCKKRAKGAFKEIRRDLKALKKKQQTPLQTSQRTWRAIFKRTKKASYCIV